MTSTAKKQLVKGVVDIEVIQHALDNGINEGDYSVLETLDVAVPFTKLTPEPCEFLPRQFGYWFHTGPGFSDPCSMTYKHRIMATDNARILGKDGVIVYGRGWVDSMSLNYARPERPGSQFVWSGERMIGKPVGRRLKGTYFLGFNAGHINYAHWITDQLPLIYYYKDKLLAQGVRLLLPMNAMAFVSQFVAMMDIPPGSIDYIDDEVVEIERLIHGSFFSFDAIPHSAMSLLKGFIGSCLPPQTEPRKKIFASRSETLTRALLNEGGLTQRLRTLGFEIVIPGRMTVAEQIQAFRAAECVVGVHGAGLANIAFCEPGTRILEIFPEYTVSSLFWMIASHFDLKYGAVFGTSFDQDVALSDQTGSWEAPFVVGEEAVMRALEACK